jgi:hypothetical protein
MADVTQDSFEARYTRGVRTRPSRPQAPLLREAGREEGIVTARATTAFALRGCALTPDGPVENAWVLVDGDHVVSIGATKPAGAMTIETGGVILCGLIDLHGHPEYNVLPSWEPPQLYDNRYRWRASPEYAAVVKAPFNDLKGASLSRVMARYAETRALIGGTTAIQGASTDYPGKVEALVRNVDLWIFGQQNARALIDLPSPSDPHVKQIKDGIASGAVTAFYIHLAEGKPEDPQSQGEFARLVSLGLLTPATVIIHGTALGEAELKDVKDAGAKLVWSPQSNLRLYGETTPAATALGLGIPMGIGADWLPSGSPSTLHELQVARRTLLRQGVTPEARKLVEMATSGAAAIAGLADHLGQLAAGRVADVLVLERLHDDPYESVLRSLPVNVSLVTIGGDLAYGRSDWLQQLTDVSQLEAVLAWGDAMTLDTTYTVKSPRAPDRLRDLRAQLLARFPRTGPIFA